MKRALAIAAAIGAMLVSVTTSWSQSDQPVAPASWTPVAGMPLTQPAQLRPNAAGIVNVKLVAKPAVIDVSGAPLLARPWGSNAGPASLDGPTIHVRPGGTIHVSFDNSLGDGTSPNPPTNIHYHGLHVSPLGISDNIFRTFDSGKTYQSVVHVTADQPTGTYWYHVHMHGLSDGQVMAGLSGLLIIDGIENLLPHGWQGVPQRQLALRDVQTTGGAINTEDNILIPQPSTRLVDALYKPTFTIHARRYEMWRLANIGSDVYYQLQLRNRAKPAEDLPFAVIAEDGEPVWEVSEHRTLLMPPGKRFDVLVLARDAGTYDLLSTPYAQRYVAMPAAPAAPTSLVPKPLPVENVNGTNTPVTQTLATATVLASTAPVSPAGPRPARLAPKHDLAAPGVHVAADHTFRFQYTKPGVPFATMINDTVFSPGEMPLVAPVRDTVEQWTLVNQTTDDHPFHVHVNGFQVLSVNGRPYHAHGHQDIVNIPAQTLVDGKLVDGRVVIRQRFARFTGWFVFHCHILQHEDAGMMATVQVRRNAHVRIQPPPEYRGKNADHMHGP